MSQLSICGASSTTVPVRLPTTTIPHLHTTQSRDRPARRWTLGTLPYLNPALSTGGASEPRTSGEEKPRLRSVVDVGGRLCVLVVLQSHPAVVAQQPALVLGACDELPQPVVRGDGAAVLELLLREVRAARRRRHPPHGHLLAPPSSEQREPRELTHAAHQPQRAGPTGRVFE